MPSTSELKQAIASGILRPHKFEVIINFPVAIPNVNAVTGFKGLARSTTIPQSTLGTITINADGRELKIPGDRTFDDFTVTLLGVQDQTVRNSLETWSENINGSVSNSGVLTSFDDYTADIELNLLSTNDEIIKTYVLQDAWCKTIGPLSMSQEQLDGSINFDVTFSFLTMSTDTTL